MKAARLYAPNDLRVESFALRQPESDEVVLRIGASGICGSDIPRVFETGAYYHPAILGHEFAGEVVEVGNEALRDCIGRRAAVIPLIGCGSCAMCQTGMPFHCQQYNFLGSRCDGGFAEYAVAPARNLVYLDEDVPFTAGAMMEPAAVGLHAVRRPGVEPGDRVVVFGAGAIGLFAAQWACLCGSSAVIHVDIREEALGRARECGSDITLNGLEQDVVERVYDLTEGRGADLAVEAAGASISTEQAFRCVRRRGRVSLMGRIDGDWTIPKDVLTGFMRKEQTVYGNWGFESYPFPQNDWDVAASAIRSHKLLTDPMISHRFPLEGIHDAMRLMADKTEYFCKVMIVPGKNG